MKLYFTTRSIPGLAGLPLAERMRRLERAAKKLTVPEKTVLNILKLLVIVPAFALLLRVAASEEQDRSAFQSHGALSSCLL